MDQQITTVFLYLLYFLKLFVSSFKFQKSNADFADFSTFALLKERKQISKIHFTPLMRCIILF